MHHFDNAAYLRNLEAAGEREFDYRTALRGGKLEEWQVTWRDRLERLLGLPQIRLAADKAPLEARHVGTVEFPAYTREKLFVSTEPGIEIPCYLLLPRGTASALPLVLTPHGHGHFGKETYVGNYQNAEDEVEGVSGERDIALQAVAEGYAVIAPDVRAFNEMSRQEDFEGPGSSCARLQSTALLYGRTLIGERVHDMGRLMDYAATRPEIDLSRVVITGNSGGGTVALFTAAVDERISVAVPGSYFCSFFDSIVSLAHCPCNIVPGIMECGEMWDVAGLIAPRPFLAVHGREDEIFPIQATEEAFGHLNTIYTRLGNSEDCELFVGDGGHRYYKERVWPFVRAKLNS